MNTLDILKYGHLTVLKSIEAIPDDKWDQSGVCGKWSSKEILIHLTTYEQLLEDVLKGVLGEPETPLLKEFLTNHDNYNEIVIPKFKDKSFREILKDYVISNDGVMELSKKITKEVWQKNGTIPWYGENYCLNDFIVYQYYGHKREHTAQIDIFTSKLI
jgi:hypothetical protein